jgi:hypothetical protein
VLLLLILALLSMFGLIAVAFVVLTGHAQRGAKSLERMGQTESLTDSTQKTLLHQAAMQVFRGPNSNSAGVPNTASVMGAHSLLETMYGNGFVMGYLDYPAPNPNPVCGGQIIEITSSVDLTRYVGCVLTVTGNRNATTLVSDPTVPVPDYGRSTRIVSLNGANPQIVAFPDGASLAHQTNALGQTVYLTFTVNSVPFSGTGFGFDSNPTHTTTAGTLNAVLPNNDPLPALIAAQNLLTARTTLERAMLPNHQAFPVIATDPRYDAYYADPAGPGGANTDYTAADFQHMLLAAQVPIYNGNQITGVSTMPSLHRPALLNYWYNRLYKDLKWPAGMTQTRKWQTLLQPYGVDGIRGNGDDQCSDPNVEDMIVMLRRRILLRPLPEDHPNFNGSNPSSQTLLGTLDGSQYWERGNQGQWDVDNDGDGVPDSIWVDLGMPVRSTADGRLYKPLFAVLCVDLDGRLNLNAHGCVAQANTAYPANTTPAAGAFAGGAAANLPFGQGFGPAEINLRPLLFNPSEATDYSLFRYQNVLGTHWEDSSSPDPVKGNLRLGFEGRYGESKLLNSATRPTVWPSPGVCLDTSGNCSLSADAYLGANKWFNYGNKYDVTKLGFTNTPANFVSVNDTGAYGTPPDLNAYGVVGLDQGGRPIYVNMGGSTNYSPYEINLGSKLGHGMRGPSQTNNPFSPTELEPLLRPFDRDASSLPGRLAALSPTLSPPPAGLNQRVNATTESWDLPCPKLGLPAHILQQAQTDLQDAAVAQATKTWILTWFSPHNFSDILTAKCYYDLRHGGQTADNAYTNNVATGQVLNSTTIQNNAALLFSTDLLCGLKMDLNRLFGNGQDSSNSVVDTPGTQVNVTLASAANGTTTTKAMSYDGMNSPGVNFATDSLQARQVYARYLYTMAMLLVDTDGLTAQLTAQLGRTATSDDVARFLAQWAVNVVDFRDRDSIMTPFIYNPTPFTSAGWNVATYHVGNPTAADATAGIPVVWGCERPELLISETLAFHDRRTEDLPNEVVDPNNTNGGKHTSPGKTSADSPAKDPNFDQRYKPQGSLFVELYNPWTDQEPRPAELCTAPNGGVDLTKTTAEDAAHFHWPVWRLITVDGATNAAKDPDDPAVSGIIERAVYFVGPTAAAWGTTAKTKLPADGTVQFQPTEDTATKTTRIAPIPPGRYAVVGPGEPTDTNQSVTYLGFWNSQNPSNVTQASTRRIELNPPAAVARPDMPDPTTAGQVRVFNKDGTTDDLAGVVNPPIAVVINQPQRLSISEPDAGYSASVFPTPKDVPLDADATIQTSATMRSAIENDGRTESIKVVHLQRLANPLLPYDQYSNPYRTIDTMPIDLTAFNGIDSTEQTKATSPVISLNNNNAGNFFWARQRGQNNGAAAATPNLWLQEPVTGSSPKANANDVPATIQATSQFTLLAALNHTLGYLNDPFGAPDANGNPATNSFPWLTWNNRPFASPLELMLVPSAKSRDLLRTFSINTAAARLYQPNPVIPPTATWYPFTHLPNFFYSAITPPLGQSTQFHRLLEYVRVPSPFVGTEIQANPALAAAAGTHIFHPPFNRISAYREPGRINLNTIYSPEVFLGLMNYYPNMTETTSAAALATDTTNWANFVRSRRGYDAAPAHQYDVFAMETPATNFPSPTHFARPFRSFGGAAAVPTLNNLNTALAPNPEIDATLLREGATAGTPLFAVASTSAFNNTNQNPFFRYQAMQRLGNLVTTRSNVYAVWITVGYFEVTIWDPNAPLNPVTKTIDTAHPDGYQLGRELGSDTGEIERHRAFYIFDRTIPVGFQRGQDLNVEKAILVKRFIE